MCGIFGAARMEGFFEMCDAERFGEQTSLVSYRGPDDCGLKTFKVKSTEASNNGNFDVFFGHRRLSIIDLSGAGHQPMTDGSGRWIIFNGEIFNYIELRKQLESIGHHFRTSTDTEVILHIYSEYGENGFNLLNGMWALAILDLPARKLVLSRDRFSMKPLYFVQNHSDIYFASEIKQLLPFLSNREVNTPILLTYLSQALVNHTAETFFKGVAQVPPRTNITICIQTGKVQRSEYWQFEQSDENEMPMTDRVEQFRSLLIDSTKIRLRSDVEVGVLLSGGLDSSTLALIAHQLQKESIGTYSIVAAESKYSEEQFIDLLSKECGIRNHKLSFSLQNVVETFEKVIYHNDEPFMGFSALAQFKILETIKRDTGITVLLSGQGGDEILLGYLKFFFFYLKTLISKREYIYALMLVATSLMARTVIHQFRFSEARRYIPRFSGGKERGFFKIKPSAVPVWNCQDIRDRQIQDIEMYSVPALTHYEDRNSMAHSMELRHPFLDHRLVNFSLALPTEAKLKHGWTKYILRESFPDLPPEIRWRRDKQPFITPEAQWLKSDLSSLIIKTFKGSRLSGLGILDDHLFLGTYKKFCNGSPFVAYGEIARTLIAEKWLQTYFN